MPAVVRRVRRTIGRWAALELAPAAEGVIAAGSHEHVSCLRDDHLQELAARWKTPDEALRPYLIIEVGSVLRGSANVMAVAKALEPPMKLYDFRDDPAAGYTMENDVHQS